MRLPVVYSILHPRRRFFALYFRSKIADSWNFDEEQAAEMFTIQPYQFEPRVSSDEADSNPEHISGDECMTSDEETNSRLQNSDWYVVRAIRLL